MKYEFHVGDYVEDITGRIGYIDSICHCKYCKERGFYEHHIMYNNGDTDYITAYEYNKGLLDYKRIGQYDFTKKDEGKIEKIDVKKAGSVFTGRETAIIDTISNKINELVEAVNRLEKKVYEGMDG